MSEIHTPWLADLLADQAALREVIFSLDYALGQWREHGPPEGYDVLASFAEMRQMIEDARTRSRRGAAGEGDHLTGHTCQET